MPCRQIADQCPTCRSHLYAEGGTVFCAFPNCDQYNIARPAPLPASTTVAMPSTIVVDGVTFAPLGMALMADAAPTADACPGDRTPGAMDAT